MINPTPVHTKNSPYQSQPDRKGLPRAVAVPMPTKEHPKILWKRVFAFSFVLLLIASGTYVFAQINNLKNAVIIQHEGDNASILSYDPASNKEVNASLFKKAGDGRFNIVLVGVGGANHPGGNLTDSIQVMSVDTINKKVGITSVPRDLYVNIPGYGYSKINATYQVGESQKAGSGAYLVRQVVGNVLGISISNFVLLDFSGAKQLVDALGGIDVNVPTAISDPLFPDDNTVGFSPFYIKAGLQHMNGTVALRYSRSRETTSDFDRSARQQLVIQAMKKKALSLGTLSNPAKVAGLLDALGQHVKTDMQTDVIRQFVSIYKDISADSSTSQVLDTSAKLGLLTSSSGSAAGYISYPVAGYGKYTDIHQWFQKNNPDPLIGREHATITVIGAGSATTKQVQAMVTTLKEYGYNAVADSAGKTSEYSSTELFEKSRGAKAVSHNYLENQLGVSIQKGSPLKSGSDFELIYAPSASK